MPENSLLIVSIADLMREVGKAYHEATTSSRDNDLDWPIWYANKLVSALNGFFEVEYTCSHIVCCLMDAEIEWLASSPQEDWSRFYAEYLTQRLGLTALASESASLVLYITKQCLICRFLLCTIAQMDLDIELRDITLDSTHHQTLVNAGGRATVPVLCICEPDIGVHWVQEVRDIIRLLEMCYGIPTRFSEKKRILKVIFHPITKSLI